MIEICAGRDNIAQLALLPGSAVKKKSLFEGQASRFSIVTHSRWELDVVQGGGSKANELIAQVFW